MLKTFEAILLSIMTLLLFTLCGCSDSAAAPENTPGPRETVIENAPGLSTDFDTAASLRMASFMGGNRALVSGDRLWCFDFDENASPVLACYTLADGVPGNFTLLQTDCVPEYLCMEGDRLYYINDNGSASVESIGTDGKDHQVLVDEPCGYLQICAGELYFCDAAGRFCKAALDGSGRQVLIDDVCCYPFVFDGRVLYQSGKDGESLHLLELEDGTDRKLTSTVSYAPVIIENTLYYTQKTGEGNRICSLELESGATQVFDSPLIQGAAEFIPVPGQGWTVRAVPADERVSQSSIPLSELGSGAWHQGGYSGYRLCDWAGEQRIDAFYENGGRLRSFVLVNADGSETEYMAGVVRQK